MFVKFYSFRKFNVKMLKSTKKFITAESLQTCSQLTLVLAWPMLHPQTSAQHYFRPQSGLPCSGVTLTGICHPRVVGGVFSFLAISSRGDKDN